ncbi:hypothetical protein [Oxalobacter aliiformigenes]|uniref:hypothetical protein n=1 Tax=Oxalobacter aliiformigenes TaxID=2946593 RepID=UPI0022AFD01A|nr:hypothetical protein [Oxalobacter aliiformigenes]WAV93887.1 hypothetical protein NB641_03900 [Oxalobacter aliiformigenes]
MANTERDSLYDGVAGRQKGFVFFAGCTVISVHSCRPIPDAACGDALGCVAETEEMILP